MGGEQFTNEFPHKRYPWATLHDKHSAHLKRQVTRISGFTEKLPKPHNGVSSRLRRAALRRAHYRMVVMAHTYTHIGGGGDGGGKTPFRRTGDSRRSGRT